MTLIAVSCKNRPNSVVEGKLRNSEKNSLKLEYLNINKTQLIDSIRINKDGSFRFKLFIEQPGLYIIKSENGKIINLLISLGEKIKIDADYLEIDKKYSISGSPDSEFLRQLVEKLSDTRNQLKVLDATYRNSTNLTEFQANEYFNRRNEIIKDQRDFSISFIIGHLSSMASIYALYQKFSPEELVLNENRDIQYMKILADTLSVKYPESDFVNTFINDARTAEKRYKNLIGLQKKILEGQNGFPDISYPDASGNLKSLSSLKGKTVLLYFWSVYSDVTKQINPDIEKTYRKYKSQGFEVFAVCIDKTRDNWLKMIKFDELSFINTIGPEFPDSDAANAYNMRSVPTNYLLDKEGNILARDLYGTELEKWLDNKL
jgi:peroxiredoxin